MNEWDRRLNEVRQEERDRLPRQSRNAYTTCDEQGCDRSPANGDVLYRANPKGEKGIFMCKQHEAATWTAPQSPAAGELQEGREQ